MLNASSPRVAAHVQTLWLFHAYLGFFIPVNKIVGNLVNNEQGLGGKNEQGLGGKNEQGLGAEREGKIQNRLERFFTLTGVSSMKRPKCRAFSQTLWLFHGYLGFLSLSQKNLE